MKTTIADLEQMNNSNVIFRGIVGSRAYGTANANSDTDERGVFFVPAKEYVRLLAPPHQINDEHNDKVYYSLLRFCQLASEANPTMPPTEFAKILKGIDISSSESSAIKELLFLKAEANEGTTICPSVAFSLLLQDKYDELQSYSWSKKPEDKDLVRNDLNELFRSELLIE